MRADLLEKDPTIITGYYWDKMPVLMKTGVYDCLNIMPKPANLHIHLPAACPTWYMVNKLTYYNFVYYNEKAQMFKVNKRGCKEPGYIKVNKLRQFWSSSTDFDDYLANLIELRIGKDETLSHQIWNKF